MLLTIYDYCRTGHFRGYDMFAEFADLNKTANISIHKTKISCRNWRIILICGRKRGRKITEFKKEQDRELFVWP